jgi:hypothetical protein
MFMMIVGEAKDGYYTSLESAQRGYWRSTLVEQGGQAPGRASDYTNMQYPGRAQPYMLFLRTLNQSVGIAGRKARIAASVDAVRFESTCNVEVIHLDRHESLCAHMRESIEMNADIQQAETVQTTNRRLLSIPVAMSLMPFISGCKLDALNPMGRVGLAEKSLIATATWAMLAVVVPVIALTPLFTWRYRASNRSTKYRPHWSHSSAIEIVGWAIPSLIIL